MNNRLKCTELTKAYGRKTVLDGVTLTLEPHRIYGLIGRNGAGKTTLLGILSGAIIHHLCAGCNHFGEIFDRIIPTMPPAATPMPKSAR